MVSNYLLFGLRIAIGTVYIVSGSEKLLQPYENFIYVIQGYDILNNNVLENLVAVISPWLEYLLGCFLVVGLWTVPALTGIGLFSAVFILVVGQAVVRGLPIDECGCFGDLVGVPLEVILLFDVIILSCVILLVFFAGRTKTLSLDRLLSVKTSS